MFSETTARLSIVLALFSFVALYGFSKLENGRGIHIAESGEAVALPGDACVINLTEARSADELNQDYLYCRVVHSCYYGTLKESFDTPNDCVNEMDAYIAANPDRASCDPETTTVWCV